MDGDVFIKWTVSGLGGVTLLLIEEKGSCILSYEDLNFAPSCKELGFVDLEGTSDILDLIIRERVSLAQ